MKPELRTILLGLYFILVGIIALILDGVQWLIDAWKKVWK